MYINMLRLLHGLALLIPAKFVLPLGVLWYSKGVYNIYNEKVVFCMGELFKII